MTGMIFLGVGLGAGVLSGLFGIGGGALIVPSLIVLAGMDVLHASATSLAALLLPVGILGVWQFNKSGFVQWKVAGYLSIGLLLGSGLGAEIGMALPRVWLERSYACFLLYLAQEYLGLVPLLRGKTHEPDPGPRKEGSMLVWLLVGTFAGILAGMFGKGGGVVLVPVLMGLFAYRAKDASGTSLAALQLPVGLPGVILYAKNGVLDFRIAAWVAAGLLAGTFFGTRIAIGLKPALFKPLFGLFLLGISIFLFLR